MGMPIATKKAGFICFAFPDVCFTPAPPGPDVPIPYPNIGQLADATKVSSTETGTGDVKVGGNYVILANTSEIGQTTGDEAGVGAQKGVQSHSIQGKVTFPQGSATVKIHGKSVVRMMDPTKQNNGNANGTVLGGVPNVLVGG